MRLRCAIILALLLFGMPSTTGRTDELKKIKPPIEKKDEKKKDEKLTELMKKKLQHAQKVLEGIALNDFATIEQNAEDLIAVSKKAEWKVIKTPQYEVYSNEFRRAAENMIEKAKAKNTDGVALAYVEMTLSCVSCHKHVREVRSTRNDPDQAPWITRDAVGE